MLQIRPPTPPLPLSAQAPIEAEDDSTEEQALLQTEIEAAIDADQHALMQGLPLINIRRRSQKIQSFQFLKRPLSR